MEETNTPKVKSCQKCGANKNNVVNNDLVNDKDEKNKKVCNTCKKNFMKFAPTVLFSLIFFSFAVYGVVTFVKDIINLFSK